MCTTNTLQIRAVVDGEREDQDAGRAQPVSILRVDAARPLRRAAVLAHQLDRNK